MKVILFLIYFVGFESFLFAQETISGVYVNDSGKKIILKDNNFIFTIPQSHSPIHFSDTLAKCTFKRVNDHFLEINSVNDYESILKTLKIKQVNSGKRNDSILVQFKVPFNSCNLKIRLYADYDEVYSFEYSQDQREIVIPNNLDVLTFYIQPEYLLEAGFDGQCYSRICFNSLEYKIENNIDFLSIEIPEMDNSFFETYFVKGEYLRVSENTIHWKGEMFKKK